jgi:hypothetical protein
MAGLGEYENVNEQSGIEGESLLGHESDFGEEDYVRKKNWPVCKPFLYHNIARDVDDARLQHAVRIYYYLWYTMCAAFFINTLAVGAAFLSIVDAHWSNWVGLILSLTYFALCWPLSFVVYYYLAYEGARLRSSVKMGTFFCAFPAQIVLCGWLALGIPKTGGGGLVLLVHAMEAGEMGTGVLNVISLMVWIFLGLASGYVLFLMWRAFRAAQASGMQPRAQTNSTSIEDDDATDTFIDVEEEVSTAKAKESEGSTSGGFSSWGVPSKLNLALPSSIRRDRPASTEATSAPAPAASPVEVSSPPPAAKYELPANFLE